MTKALALAIFALPPIPLIAAMRRRFGLAAFIRGLTHLGT
jgi:hypothetical protein